MAGDYFDPETWEIQINNDKAVEALQYYGDLMTKYKVVVPDAITWEFDEIVAGGQNDRYAMTITLAPYGTLINDPKLSTDRRATGPGPWRPAHIRRAESRSSMGGWTFGVPQAGKNTGMGVRVHPDGHAARNGCTARWSAATRRRGCRC